MRPKAAIHAVFSMAVSVAAQTPKLEILTPAFHQFEGGPAMRGLPDYRDGERLFFSCQVSGHKANEKDKVSLSWTIRIADEAGLALTPPESKSLEAELAPEDKDWKPRILYQAEMPPTADCDNCLLVVQLTDKISGAQAMSEQRFAIRSKEVEPSKELAIRNFRFLRGEEDGAALAVPAFRPGDEVWARFEITGFAHGEKNRIHVEYGLSVFRPSGKLLYQEPKAASAEESSFYPKRWAPGMLSLKLDSKLPLGEYPIVIEVRDEVGKQRAEARFAFRIE